MEQSFGRLIIPSSSSHFFNKKDFEQYLFNRMGKASSVRWYVFVLKKEDENILVKALEIEAQCCRGRLKQI